MSRRLWPMGLLLAAGCLSETRPAAPIVSTDPFAKGPWPMARSSQSAYGSDAPPAAQAAQKRVMALGDQIIASNPQLGLRPVFITIVAPKDEIFHRGTSQIWLTDSLVRHCTTDPQLAAVICLELGKMIAERAAQAPPDSHDAELPPFELAIGNDAGGINGPADGTRLMELADYQRRHPHNPASSAPVDPDALARKFLERAGYHGADLDTATPVIQAAEVNCNFEKQINKGNAPVDPMVGNPPNNRAVTLGSAVPVGQPGQILPPTTAPVSQSGQVLPSIPSAVPVGQPSQVLPPIPTTRP